MPRFLPFYKSCLVILSAAYPAVLYGRLQCSFTVGLTGIRPTGTLEGDFSVKLPTDDTVARETFLQHLEGATIDKVEVRWFRYGNWTHTITGSENVTVTRKRGILGTFFIIRGATAQDCLQLI